MSAQARPTQRVAIIGPLLPFRGGIAQHTTMLFRALRKRNPTIAVSFTRQYPKWLFPGESDRDPDYVGHRENATSYLIDSLNPFSWRTAVEYVLDSGVETVVVPLWTVFWAPCFWYVTRRFARAGLEVIFLCHNVSDHESAGWKSNLAKAVLANGDKYLVHSEDSRTNLLRYFPGAKVNVHPHPVYDQFPVARGILPRRGKLELLFFGFVRPYKGLDDLLEAMALLDKTTDAHLTIAGEFWEGKRRTIEKISVLRIQDRVTLIPEFVNEQDTAELFHRADLVVLPYRSATSSGVVPIAYHYLTPVIVTCVGGLPEAVEDGASGWVVSPNAPEELADRISDFANGEITADLGSIAKLVRRMSWQSFCDTLLS